MLLLLLLSDKRTGGRLRSCNRNIQAGYSSGMWRDGTGYIGLVGWLGWCMYVFCVCAERESGLWENENKRYSKSDEALRRRSIVSRVGIRVQSVSQQGMGVVVLIRIYILRLAGASYMN